MRIRLVRILAAAAMLAAAACGARPTAPAATPTNIGQAETAPAATTPTDIGQAASPTSAATTAATEAPALPTSTLPPTATPPPTALPTLAPPPADPCQPSGVALAAEMSLSYTAARSDGLGTSIYMARADGSGPAEFVRGARAASWSPDGLRLAYLSETGDAARPYDLHVADYDGTGQTTLPITFALDPDPSPRWSPDGRYLAVEGAEEGVYVVDLETGAVTSVSGEVAGAWGPAWAPDSARLAFQAPLDPALNTQYRIYTVAPNGADQVRIEADVLNDYVQQWSPDGSRLLVKSGGDTGPQQIYTLSLDGAERTRLFGDQSYAHPLAYSPNGQQLAYRAFEFQFDDANNITGSSEWLMVADASGANPRALEQLDLAFGQPGFSVPQWSANGRYVAYLRGVPNAGADLVVADVCAGTLATIANSVFEPPSWKPGPALDPAEAVVAVAAITPTPGPTAAVAEPHDHALRLAWSPDGSALVASTEAGARIYDPASGAEIALLPASASCCDVRAVGGSYLATLEAGGTGFGVYLWPDGDLVFEQRDNPAESFQSIAISPDGTLLATGERFQVRLWNLPTGELRATFQTADLSDSYVTNVGFTRDGRTLVSVTQWEGRVHEWNTSTLALRRSFRISTVTQFVLSPDTRILLADYATPGFERWDVAGGFLIDRHPTIISAGGGSTVISPDNRRVAVWGYKSGENNMLAVWEVSSDTLLHEVAAGPAVAHTWRSAAFSPDGGTLAVGDTAGMIYLYETATWTETGRIQVP